MVILLPNTGEEEDYHCILDPGESPESNMQWVVPNSFQARAIKSDVTVATLKALLALPTQLVSSATSPEHKFKVSILSRGGVGWMSKGTQLAQEEFLVLKCIHALWGEGGVVAK